MSDIFISYRRDDSEGHAGRLFEGLKARFGRRRVFIDVDGIEPGRDFRRIIDEHVSSCHVLLALIGKDWLHAADKDGRRRLDAPEDFVRLEIAAALRRDIAVIPVLVQGATMPGKEELPPDLQAMVSRNGAELRHSRWDDDFARLEETLQSLGVKVVTVELLSKKGINYSKLRNLLSAGNWKKADHETYEMMVKAANRSPAEGLAVVDIRNFPTVDLHTIDQLWVGYSDGRFGFSLQKELFDLYQCGRGQSKDYVDKISERLGQFGKAIGWVGDSWLDDYSQLTFDLSAPKGHLPGWGIVGDGGWGGWSLFRSGKGYVLLTRDDLKAK